MTPAAVSLAPRTPPPAAGSPWQHRVLGWLNRRKRLSALVPPALLVMGTPHSCPFC